MFLLDIFCEETRELRRGQGAADLSTRWWSYAYGAHLCITHGICCFSQDSTRLLFCSHLFEKLIHVLSWMRLAAVLSLLVLYGVSPLGTENLSTKDHQSSPSSLFFYSFIHTSERKWQICWLNIRGISWTSMNKPKGSPPKNTIKITSRIIPMTPFYMNRLCSCWVTPSF